MSLGEQPPGRLAIVLPPATGESIHGYVRRLAAANGHANPESFASALGLGCTVGPLSRTATWRRLAAWTGHDSCTLEAMRWRRATEPTGRNTVTFLGAQVPVGFLLPRRPRSCPACLVDNGIHRDLWSVSHMLACPVHGCLLADACAACGRPVTADTNGWPCVCGAPSDAMALRPAPAACLRVARHLSALLGGSDRTGLIVKPAVNLAPPFDRLDANDCLAYLAVFGIAATGSEDDAAVLLSKGYRAGVPSDIVAADPVSRLEAAVAIMDGWPDAFTALLHRIEDRIGRGDRDFTEAFSSRVGRMLRHPPRGSRGVPLPLVHEAVDAHWNKRHQARRRQRNLTVSHASALALHATANATRLAAATGSAVASPLHRRVLRRVHEDLSEAERALFRTDLEAVVASRFNEMLDVARGTISGHAARRVLEGGKGKETLVGWDKPGLLPLDPALQGRRYAEVPGYSAAAVHRLLARLQAVALPTTDSAGLVPLLGVAVRLASLRPWYRKEDLLLDILSGALPVYTIVDRPRLGDVIVNLDLLRAYVAARDPALVTGPWAGHAPLSAANDVLRVRVGPGSAITLNEARRLVAAGLVRVIKRTSIVRNRDRPVVERLYRIDDLVAFAVRRATGHTLRADTAALGTLCDVTDRLVALERESRTLRGVARALSKEELRTPSGGAWSHSAVAKALARARIGLRVDAIDHKDTGHGPGSGSCVAKTG